MAPADPCGTEAPAAFDPWSAGPTPADWAPSVACLPAWRPPALSGGPGRHATGRVVVVAPHPDDETLAHGGVIAQLAAAGWAVEVVGVTAGEGSHPGLAGLAARRRAEQRAALAELAPTGRLTELDLPDGQVAEHVEHLADTLMPILIGAALVLTTWANEPHPDHRAVAEACRRAAPADVLWTAPVWAWHTERPGRTDLLDGARRVDLAPAAVEAKQRALAAHRTQMEPLDGPPVVPPHVRRHSETPWEVLVPCASR